MSVYVSAVTCISVYVSGDVCLRAGEIKKLILKKTAFTNMYFK